MHVREQTPCYIEMRFLRVLRVHRIALAQLHKSDRGLNIRQVVLETRIHHFVTPGTFSAISLPRIVADAVEPHHAHALGQFLIARSHHAAFAGRQCLGGIKAE